MGHDFNIGVIDFMELITAVFTLLVIYQVKHFLADYPLQLEYHLQKFRDDRGFFLPLLSHATIHGSLTFIIVCVFTWSATLALALAVFDITAHSLMDRAKGGSKYLGRYKMPHKYFWWSFGLDQSVHHLTHYVIIFVIVSVKFKLFYTL